MNIYEIAGFISVIGILAAIIPYIRDIWAGNTKPQRMAVVIFNMTGFISFFSQLAEGATTSLMMPGAFLAINAIMLYLAYKKGIGGASKVDMFSLAAVLLILVVWHFTKSAATALILIQIINVIGVSLVIKKAYNQPYTEYMPTWAIASFASIFGAISVGELDWLLMMPSLRNMVMTGLVALTVIHRRKIVPKPKSSKKK